MRELGDSFACQHTFEFRIIRQSHCLEIWTNLYCKLRLSIEGSGELECTLRKLSLNYTSGSLCHRLCFSHFLRWINHSAHHLSRTGPSDFCAGQIHLSACLSECDGSRVPVNSSFLLSMSSSLDVGTPRLYALWNASVGFSLRVGRYGLIGHHNPVPLLEIGKARNSIKANTAS